MPFLETLESTDEPERMGLFFRALASDPRGLFDELRRDRPVLDLPLFVVVSSWSGISDVLTRGDVFNVTYGPHIDPSVGPFMLGRDAGIEGWRDKAAMQSIMRLDDLASVRNAVARCVGTAMRRVVGSGLPDFDLVTTVARAAPLRVVRDVFGFAADEGDMLSWSRAAQADMFHNLGDRPDLLAANIAAGQAMRRWAAYHIESLRPWDRIRTDDTISRLLRARGSDAIDLPDASIVSNICGLLIGAIETSSQAIVNATEQILLKPDREAIVREAARSDDPSRSDAYVWEALRFNPVAPLIIRQAAREAVLAPGSSDRFVIHAGRKVALAVGAVMFDDDLFPDPDVFEARAVSPDLHFGSGAHSCLGRHVGRQIVCEAVRQVMLVPQVRLLRGADGRVDNAGGPFAERFRLAIGR